MTTEHPKLDLLVKLLSKSTTEVDNEALMAIRAANRALLAEGWTWERLLRGRITIVEDPFTALQRPPAPSSARPQDTSFGWRTPPASPKRQAPPPPQHPQVATNPNQFAGYCYCCGYYIDANAGRIFRWNNKWEIACLSDATSLNNGKAVPPSRAKKRPITVNLGSIF